MGGERRLDCRGLTCPQPVIQTKEILEEMPGGTLHVIVDSEASCTNVRRFAEGEGHRVEVEELDGAYHLLIQMGEGVPMAEPPSTACGARQGRRTVVYISSEEMGRGDEQLGRALMAAYLDTLSHFVKEISHAIFVNAGVKLVAEGSPVLEQVRALERMDVDILACGTCLNYFGIQEKLRVGSVSNMYAILEILSRAGKVLSP